jgi:hypothetical protein
MKLSEREYLADAYGSAWRAVKKDKTSEDVLEHGWFSINYGNGVPRTKCRAEKLLKGLAVLNARIERGHVEASV